VTDGLLVTGQNRASAAEAAQALLKLLPKIPGGASPGAAQPF